MRAELASGAAPPFQSQALAGVLLLAMTLLAVARLVIPGLPAALAGVLAWLAMLLLLPRLQRASLLQAGALLAVGLACAGWAAGQGVEPDWAGFLDANLGLLALLAGVSFLRLVTLPVAGAEEALPRGIHALWRTLLGTHLFAAVINLSALLITGDRLAERGRLSRPTTVLLTRAFTTAAFWSPFFAAMGVALTYAPGASLGALVAQGLPLAVLALLYTLWEVRRLCGAKVASQPGYPIHFGALWIPAALVAGVLLVHRLWPAMSVILVVSGLALSLTVLVSLWRAPGQAYSRLRRHTLDELPRMAGELTLFLAAGALSAGLNSLFQALGTDLPMIEINVPALVGLLAAMVLLAVIGVHPVISIAAVGTWLAPLHADPNLLGTLFLCVWAIGVTLSPLSGVSLALIGRYALSARQILRWHGRYALVMWLAASLALWLAAGIHGPGG